MLLILNYGRMQFPVGQSVRRWCCQHFVTSCQYASAPLVQSAFCHQLSLASTPLLQSAFCHQLSLASAPLVQSAFCHQLSVSQYATGAISILSPAVISQCATGAVSILSPVVSKPMRHWCSQHFVTSCPVIQCATGAAEQIGRLGIFKRTQLVIK
jgi:hypothetical protein